VVDPAALVAGELESLTLLVVSPHAKIVTASSAAAGNAGDRLIFESLMT
jgi:hypothetical protein